MNVEAVTANLLGEASKILGFEVTGETYRRITPDQASTLLSALGERPEFRELARYSGNGIAEGFVWLTERTKGNDIPLDEVSQRTERLPAPPADFQRSTTTMTDEQIANDAALDFLSMATGIPESWKALTQPQARLALTQLGARADFRDAALQRGNPVSEAWLWLNHKASTGADLPQSEAKRLASGLGPSSLAPKDDDRGPPPSDEQLTAYSRAATAALSPGRHSGSPHTAMSAAEAKLQLAAKHADANWAAKALTRGTPEAAENIRLNAAAAGVALSEGDVERHASGLGDGGNSMS
jgi:hypothetical protein